MWISQNWQYSRIKLFKIKFLEVKRIVFPVEYVPLQLVSPTQTRRDTQTLEIGFRYGGFIDDRSTELDTIFNCHFLSQIVPTFRPNYDL